MHLSDVKLSSLDSVVVLNTQLFVKLNLLLAKHLPSNTQLQKKPISHFSGLLWKSELRNKNIFIQ